MSVAIATTAEFLEPSLQVLDVCLEQKARIWGEVGNGYLYKEFFPSMVPHFSTFEPSNCNPHKKVHAIPMTSRLPPIHETSPGDT